MNQKNVITLTLTPSLDRTFTVRYLAIGYHNRTTETTRLDPAGSGFSISRALHRMDCPTHAVVLLGDNPTARAYEALTDQQPFPTSEMIVPGATRSNVVVLDVGNKTETHLVEDSTEVTREDLQKVTELLLKQIKPGDIVVLSGELPSGIGGESYAGIVDMVHAAGAEVALEGQGEALSGGLRAKPEIVMLSQNEAESLFNHPVRIQDDMLYCTGRLCEQGAKIVLMATNDCGGALLETPDGVWVAGIPLEEQPGTRSGVQSAMLAGLLSGYVRGLPWDETLRLAAASMLYTYAKIGSEFGMLDELEECAGMVTIEPVNRS